MYIPLVSIKAGARARVKVRTWEIAGVKIAAGVSLYSAGAQSASLSFSASEKLQQILWQVCEPAI